MLEQVITALGNGMNWMGFRVGATLRCCSVSTPPTRYSTVSFAQMVRLYFSGSTSTLNLSA
jgi:hypothetical protein